MRGTIKERLQCLRAHRKKICDTNYPPKYKRDKISALCALQDRIDALEIGLCVDDGDYLSLSQRG